MENNRIHISKGITLQHFLPGVAIIIYAIAMFFSLNVFIAIPFLYLGIVILLSVKGVVIDIEKEKLKKYFNFFFFKIKIEESFSDYNRVYLSLLRESQTMNYKSISTTVRTKTFEIYLMNDSNRRIYINEYTDYKHAREILLQLSKALVIPATDIYKEHMDQLWRKRKEGKSIY